jgi:hypothetical protein
MGSLRRTEHYTTQAPAETYGTCVLSLRGHVQPARASSPVLSTTTAKPYGVTPEGMNDFGPGLEQTIPNVASSRPSREMCKLSGPRVVSLSSQWQPAVWRQAGPGRARRDPVCPRNHLRHRVGGVSTNREPARRACLGLAWPE